MSTQEEIDYEKKFQEELAIATELSLETQALDDYNRAKKYGYALPPKSTNNSSNIYATSNRPIKPPQPIAAPRRSAGINQTNTAAKTNEDNNSSALQQETNDLISFSSPTTKTSENVNAFDKLIEDLQKLPTQQTALVPLGPTAAAPAAAAPVNAGYMPAAYVQPLNASAAFAAPPATHAYAYAPNALVGASGMQMVPYTPPPNQQQKIPLTNEHLQKLYNMPHANAAAAVMPTYAPGFVAPQYAAAAAMTSTYQPLYPQLPPHLMGLNNTAAYRAPQYPGYGLPYAAMPASSTYASMPQQQQQQPPHLNSQSEANKNSNFNNFMIPNKHSSSMVDAAATAVGGASSTAASTSSSAAQYSRKSSISTGAMPRRSSIKQRATGGNDLIDLNQDDE